MTDPQQELETFARVRANLSGQDSVFWWTGNVHSQIPGTRSTRMCAFEGFNVSRIVEVEGGYQLSPAKPRSTRISTVVRSSSAGTTH